MEIPVGFKKTDNVRQRDAIEGMMKNNGGFCPCVPQTDWNEDTRCICKKMREENICKCGYLVKE